ncbi:GH25 family lysozyme [Lapidilactobacillus luobeiensis]|uniref:GH25 family lysozyme n=1 Tax=Lapidilactobacillus luobeiensis TaxID=2950371 RepID=UPI0021C2C813|nr:GH25 family lysozyme [Lapidilactobacillus luobeiensis]
MYQVWIRQSWTGKEQLIHSAKTNSLKLGEAVVTLDTADINTFTFNIYPLNPGYGQLNYLTTLIRVVNTHKKTNIFEGRVLLPSDSLDNTGMLYKSITCESYLAFLHDSSQPFQEFTNQSRRQILKALIDNHNNQVESYKNIRLGNVDFGQDKPIEYCYTDENDDTYNNISSLVMSGFESKIRNNHGFLFLDVQQSFGGNSSQIISIDHNLLAAARSIDPTALFTVLKPLGPVIDSSNGDKITPNMNISSVNDGSLYLRNQRLIDQFGIQVKTKQFDDAKTPSELKKLGEKYLLAQQIATIHLQLSVIDLTLANGGIDDLWYGNSYMVDIPYMSVKGNWRISQQTLNLNNPDQNTITIGDRVVGQENYNNTINNNIKSLSNIQNVVKRQNARLLMITSESEQYQASNNKTVADLLARIKILENTSAITGGYYEGAIIDVSYYQDVIDWSAAKNAGLALAIVRVQDGSTFIDPNYKTYLADITSLGINYAVYAFFRGQSIADSEQEAINFYNRTQQAVAGKVQPRFYAIDVETIEMGGNASLMRGGVEAYMNKLNALGIPDSKIVLYIANNLYSSFNLNVSRAGSIWLPTYGANDGNIPTNYKPSYPYDLWQYTSRGKLAGITTLGLDMNTNPSTRFKEQYLKK